MEQAIDTQKTFDWLDRLCESALNDARGGDTVLANRLGTVPALSHYFNNVFTTRAVSKDTWSQAFNPYLKEANRLRLLAESEDQQVETASRISSLETKFDDLSKLVKQWMESQAETDEETPAEEPAKPAKKKRADDPVAETPAEEPAEGEAD